MPWPHALPAANPYVTTSLTRANRGVAFGAVTESEGRLERFIHLFASTLAIGELVVNGRAALRSPMAIGAALVSLAIMWRQS